MKTCKFNEKEITEMSEQKKKEIRGGRKKKHLSTLNSKVKKAKNCLINNKTEQFSKYIKVKAISSEKRKVIKDLFNKFSIQIKELKKERRSDLKFKKEDELKLLEEKQKVVQNILNNREERFYEYISRNRCYKMKELFSLGSVEGMRSLEKDLNIQNINKWIDKED